MSSRRQRSIQLGGRYRQVSLYVTSKKGALLHTIFQISGTGGIMMASSKGNSFRVTGHLCGEFTGSQRPVTRGFDVFFDMRLNKGLSKQSWSWWFETRSYPLWRHCNVSVKILIQRIQTHKGGILSVYLNPRAPFINMDKLNRTMDR